MRSCNAESQTRPAKGSHLKEDDWALQLQNLLLYGENSNVPARQNMGVLKYKLFWS